MRTKSLVAICCFCFAFAFMLVLGLGEQTKAGDDPCCWVSCHDGYPQDGGYTGVWSAGGGGTCLPSDYDIWGCWANLMSCRN